MTLTLRLELDFVWGYWGRLGRVFQAEVQHRSPGEDEW